MNSIVHFEIPARDMKRAGSFYQDVFGWKLEKFEDNYHIATTAESGEDGMPKKPGSINGALMRDEEIKHPLVVIDVPDIADHIGKVEKAGGRIITNTQEVGGMGYYARVMDTEGNIIGLWQNLQSAEA